MSPVSPLFELEKSVSRREFSNYQQNKKILKKNTISERVNDEDVPRIINLPKLPFGKHCTYNEENEFVRKHFAYDEETQLAEKKKGQKAILMKNKKLRKKTSPLKTVASKKIIQEFDNVGGKLYIEFNQEPCVNYFKQKVKFSQPKSLDSSPRGQSNIFLKSPKITLEVDEKKTYLPFMFSPSPISLFNKQWSPKSKNLLNPN